MNSFFVKIVILILGSLILGCLNTRSGRCISSQFSSDLDSLNDKIPNFSEMYDLGKWSMFSQNYGAKLCKDGLLECEIKLDSLDYVLYDIRQESNYVELTYAPVYSGDTIALRGKANILIGMRFYGRNEIFPLYNGVTFDSSTYMDGHWKQNAKDFCESLDSISSSLRNNCWLIEKREQYCFSDLNKLLQPCQ